MDTTTYSAIVYKSIITNNQKFLRCSKQIDFNITVNPVPVTQLTQTSVICSSDGSATATVLNNPATSYNISWSNGFSELGITSSVNSNIPAGNYKATVTESLTACSSVDSIEVTNSSTPPVNQIQSLIANCSGSSGGSVNINTSGGFPPYNYSWNDGPSTATNRTALSNGDYTITVLDDFGCSTSLSFTISDQSISNSIQNISVCKNTNYTYPDNTSELIIGNTSHVSTFTGVAGCDSIITTNITMNTVNVTTNTVGATISSEATNATYQWLNCDNGFSVINNETGASYSSNSNGNYAVEVTQNNCTDTSACVSILTVGIAENNAQNNIKLYPNPTSENFTIDLGDAYQTVSVSISDLTGRLIQSKNYDNTNQILPIIIQEPAGVYFVLVESQNKKSVIRLVKK